MEKSGIQCIGFIMDGNRRWAKGKGVPAFEGHQKGGEVLFDSILWVRDAGIPHAVYYAFSTENWSRSEEEVFYLMQLFREFLTKIETWSKENNVKIRAVGRREDFADDIQIKIKELELESTKFKDTKTTIWIALSYGGRAEITSAVNEAIKNGVPVTEETFERLLWTADLPDPDIVVRTGGEQRLSNFLTWKTVYSELYFIEKPWPTLTKSDFADILMEYEKRERRRGV